VDHQHPLYRAIIGGLRAAINDHGPIERSGIESAAKRIARSISATLDIPPEDPPDNADVLYVGGPWEANPEPTPMREGADPPRRFQVFAPAVEVDSQSDFPLRPGEQWGVCGVWMDIPPWGEERAWHTARAIAALPTLCEQTEGLLVKMLGVAAIAREFHLASGADDRTANIRRRERVQAYRDVLESPEAIWLCRTLASLGHTVPATWELEPPSEGIQ
jgi:hypothetical protein